LAITGEITLTGTITAAGITASGKSPVEIYEDSNNFWGAVFNGTQLRYLGRVANVAQVDINGGTLANNTTYKAAISIKTNDFVSALSGAVIGTDNSGTVPVVSKMNIGSNRTFAGNFNGHIRSIRYYPVRLSNANLQALTS
jgi:hypothetical protein